MGQHNRTGLQKQARMLIGICGLAKTLFQCLGKGRHSRQAPDKCWWAAGASPRLWLWLQLGPAPPWDSLGMLNHSPNEPRKNAQARTQARNCPADKSNGTWGVKQTKVSGCLAWEVQPRKQSVLGCRANLTVSAVTLGWDLGWGWRSLRGHGKTPGLTARVTAHHGECFLLCSPISDVASGSDSC